VVEARSLPNLMKCSPVAFANIDYLTGVKYSCGNLSADDWMESRS